MLAKSEFFKAIAEYHQARVAQEKGAYGEGVTRFKVRFVCKVKCVFFVDYSVPQDTQRASLIYFQQAEQLMGNAVKQSLGLVDCKVNLIGARC